MKKKLMEKVMERLIQKGEVFSAELVMLEYNLSRRKYNKLIEKYRK